MKIIISALFTVILFTSANSYAQTFSKIVKGTEIVFKGSVSIEDGHNEQIMVFVTASVNTEVWKSFGYKKDKDLFELIIQMLALKAQYTLKNSSSFQPLKKQFFMWEESQKSFVCIFKMMGRNGYGNLIETDALVSYIPEKENGGKVDLPKKTTSSGPTIKFTEQKAD